MLNKVRNRSGFQLMNHNSKTQNFLIRIQVFIVIHLIVWDAYNNLIIIVLKLSFP